MCEQRKLYESMRSLESALICAELYNSSKSKYILHLLNHGCILPGLGTYHFSPILLPTRKSNTIRHLENCGNQNFTEAFVTLIVTM